MAGAWGALLIRSVITGRSAARLRRRSSDMQTIFPILRYNDARGAIRSLCATFGFVELFSVPESGPIVQHARLMLGTNLIMLGSVRLDENMTSPQSLGATTQLSTCMLTISTRTSKERD